MLNYTVLVAVALAIGVQHSVSQNVSLTTLINQEIQISTLTSTANWNVNFGAATDIAIGADGTLWSVGIDSDAGGNRIYKWIPTQKVWKYMFGSASKIAVDPVGNAWVVTRQNQIFKWTSSGWDQVPGTATDISIGADGSVWSLGTNLQSTGYGVYKWDDWNQNWVSNGGTGMTIAVDPSGNPYVITRQNRVRRWSGTAWNDFDGLARDISVGADGTVYIIGTNTVFGGYSVFKWDLADNYWIGIPIGAVHVAVDPNGNPRFVNSFKQVIQFQPETLIPCSYDTWELIPGDAMDIGIGSEGSMWIVGRTASSQGGYQVERWVPGTKDWTKYPDVGAQRITVDRSGNAWIVDSQTRVQRWSGIRWEILPGIATDISAGANGTVWIIGRNSDGSSGLFKWIPERQVWQDNDVLSFTGGNIQVSGYSNRVAVDPNDNPWVIADNGYVYRGTEENGWSLLFNGNAKDIGIGADGSVYIIGTNAALGGYEILLWNEETQSWALLPGENGAAQVAVDKNGNPYLVDDFAQVLRPKC